MKNKGTEPDEMPEKSGFGGTITGLIALTVIFVVILGNHAGAVEGRHGWGWILFLSAAASGVLWIAWFIAAQNIKPRKTPRTKEECDLPADSRRVAVLVVHGMGVQDKYQMLDSFARSIPEFTGRPAGQVCPMGGTAGDDHASLCVEGKLRIDVHEAYWGFLFNRLTTIVPNLIFGAKALVMFAPTLFTRFWRKRLAEAVFVAAGLTVLYFFLAGAYGGFVISARRLETLQAGKEMVEARDAKRTTGTVKAAEAYSAAEKAYVELRSRNYDELPPVGLGIMHDEDKAAGQTFLRDIQGSRIETFPRWGEIWQEAANFVGLSAKRTIRAPWDDAIPMDYPLRFLKDAPKWFIVLSVVYALAFGLLLLSALRLAVALCGLFWGLIERTAEDSHLRALRVEKNFIKGVKGALGGAIVPVFLFLTIYPSLDLLLVQLFSTAALVVFVLKGLAYWVDNFLGDVNIYSTLNANAVSFKAREEATDLVAGCIRDLLVKEKKGVKVYDRVIVVAHSLGSVVALHALRRVHLVGDEASSRLGDFGAFVTIGSPLRKFRQLFKPKTYKWMFGDNAILVDNNIYPGEGITAHGETPWFNYWYGSDLFADRLAYYTTGKALTDLAPPEESGKPDDADTRKALEELYRRAQQSGSPDLDRTGFQVGDRRDCYLGVRPRLWSHSDYWTDRRFIDDLLDMALKDTDALRTMKIATKPQYRCDHRDADTGQEMEEPAPEPNRA